MKLLTYISDSDSDLLSTDTWWTCSLMTQGVIVVKASLTSCWQINYILNTVFSKLNDKSGHIKEAQKNQSKREKRGC